MTKHFDVLFRHVSSFLLADRPRVFIDETIRYENHSIILDCQICSNPSAKAVWTKNEHPLPENSTTISVEEKQFRHSFDDQCFHSILFIHVRPVPSSSPPHRSLVLSFVQSSHPKKFGRYECRATNYLGYQMDHIDIHPRSGHSTSPFALPVDIASFLVKSPDDRSFFKLSDRTNFSSKSKDEMSLICLLVSLTFLLRRFE